MFERKLLRAVACNEHVLALIKDSPRKPDGITNAFDGNNSTGFQRRAIHEDRIELNVPVSIEMRSHTRVEYRLILELDNRVLTRIQRRTAFFKNAPAPVESALHSILTDCFEFG